MGKLQGTYMTASNLDIVSQALLNWDEARIILKWLILWEGDTLLM